jgi:predicted dehydrogenase
VRWLIVGHGKITANFIEAARGTGHEIVAVAGRNSERASIFANKNGIEKSGEDLLLLSEGVDAAYIATPHTGHCDGAITLLAKGVPVLCEKPLAVNHRQVDKMVNAAKESNTFLMEAMWTRHLPIYEEVIDWIKKGLIGEPKLVDASLGFNSPYDPESRLWNPKLAGGSLLDVGIYPLTLADLIYETTPENIFSLAELSPDGVDAHIAITLQFQDSALATLGSAINLSLPNGATILGESGSIEIPYFWCAQKAFTTKGSEKREIFRPHEINGFEYQIREVDRCLSEGLTQSPKVSWKCSLSMIQLMDSIRSEIGVSYPADDEEHDGI